MRWSEQQATQFLRDHSGMSDAFTRYIVHRSASVPAQMCSYKIGMMKVLELQDKMVSDPFSRTPFLLLGWGNF